MKHITFCKGHCTCIDCNFECQYKEDMIKHCKKEKHFAEITLTKNIDFRR